MSDKPKIPDWQRNTSGSAATITSPESLPSPPSEHEGEQVVQAPVPTEEDIPTNEDIDLEGGSAELLDQAERFLEDPVIRDAPRQRKVAFLESKGVRVEDIETLLGTAEAEPEFQELEEAGERAWATVSSGPISDIVINLAVFGFLKQVYLHC